jgi:Ni,Fe-hydrogenase maturation factor
VDADYQLTVEDSVAIGEHDVVVFADADAAGPAPFSFRRVAPEPGLPWSSHGLEPAALVALADGLSGRPTEAYVLGIRGYDFGEFREGISGDAGRNLEAALRFLEPVLRERSFRAAARPPAVVEG